MREVSSRFEGFSIGLRKYAKVPRNTQVLTQCLNAKVGRSGLEEYTSITSPFVALPTLSHPFPQLIPTMPARYIAVADKVYLVNTDWSLTSQLTGITGSRLFHVADFGAWQVWTNGTKLIERNYSTGVFSISAETWTARTVCNFRGQLVVGGISTSRDHQVFYSQIGTGTLATVLAYTGVSPSAGMMPMLWRKQGSVYMVKPLGKAIMVYGSCGITAMIKESEYALSYIPVFGRKEIANFGIASAHAVAGDDTMHVFIDEGGTAWQIGEDLVMKELGYQEFFSAMTMANIVGSFDSNQKEFYFTDGSNTYLLSQGGLTWIFENPTSLEFVSGGLIGVRGQSADTTFVAVTDTIDFGNRGVKTITGVELGMTWPSALGATLEVAVDYRYNTTSAFTRSAFKAVNANGFVFPIVSAVEFRLVIKASSYIGCSLDYADIRWKQSDKRMIRGTYATATPQTAAQSNS